MHCVRIVKCPYTSKGLVVGVAPIGELPLQVWGWKWALLNRELFL